MLNNVLTAWSHSQSKAFADKFKCHGCVKEDGGGGWGQRHDPLLRPPAARMSRFGIVQYNAM